MENKYQISSIPRKFELIANQIVDYIHTDNIKEGQKLPTERQLSELLNVSRSSIREGIRVLELFKYIDSRQGEGTFVSEPYPFLIPYQILDQRIDANILKNYYEFGLSTAKSIIDIAMKKDILIDPPIEFKDNQSFLAGFWSIIDYLGKEIDNNFYHYVCLSIYTLALKYGLPTINSLTIHDFIHAFNQRNVKAIEDYFEFIFNVFSREM